MATTVESRAARNVPSQMLDITRKILAVLGSEARGMESEGSGWGASVASMSVLGLPLLSSGLVSVGESFDMCAVDCMVAWLFLGDSCGREVPQEHGHRQSSDGRVTANI